MSMSIFSRLDPDIMHTHILPRLDGTTLIVLFSVCSELRHMICHNNEDLWRNICTSKWPSLLKDPIVHNVISTFPGGYRSFFSDAFPSLHHLNNSHCSYPLTIDLIHAVDIYIHGEYLTSSVRVQSLNTDCLSSSDLFHLTFDDLNMSHIHTKEWKEEDVLKNLWTLLKLSWIVIDPIRKRAANLLRSSCEPVRVSQRNHERGLGEHTIQYELVMAG
ncbi:putative F-box domain, leucine-rich repeat domain, L domain-containing protein [Medicago truncatula]|uniref:Putative F-box domain, leucine-rich repeat domain, L domain-containing protein n=1 Tax=Medicago truncatula TaxID=3880 RepID=A0A396IT42_MEDTR|nr:F-box protein At2g27310 [Medicago truncatula]RHN67828.1 putative F-box domain, leucine-rich repeat domain, L domain-containing protein [Medicago truncatula]